MRGLRPPVVPNNNLRAKTADERVRNLSFSFIAEPKAEDDDGVHNLLSFSRSMVNVRRWMLFRRKNDL
jgi:hypothetical protein